MTGLRIGVRASADKVRYATVIDLKRVRENPEAVRESQRARGEDPALVDELLAADEARRSAIQAADELRAEQKAFGKKIGQAAPEDRPALLEGSNELKARVKEAEAAEAEALSLIHISEPTRRTERSRMPSSA